MSEERHRPSEPEGDEPGSSVSPRWVKWRRSVDLDEYDRRWEAMQSRGESVHGEMDFVERLLDGHVVSILDAGCGTGRLGIEADRRGHRSVGVDLDADMIERARRKAPHITWIHGDLAGLDLGESFDVAVMAGNIPLFCAAGSQGEIISSLARHLVPGGWLICGFSLEKHPGAYSATDFERDASSAGLHRHGWYRSWDQVQPNDPATFATDSDLGDYVVLVYRR